MGIGRESACVGSLLQGTHEHLCRILGVCREVQICVGTHGGIPTVANIFASGDDIFVSKDDFDHPHFWAHNSNNSEAAGGHAQLIRRCGGRVML